MKQEISGQLGYITPKDIFYNDVPTPLANTAISQLRPESENALSTGSSPPAWADSVFNGRRAYVHTLLDHCIPPQAQKGMLAATGVVFQVADFNTSHSPFLSQPRKLSQTIIEWTKQFAELD